MTITKDSLPLSSLGIYTSVLATCGDEGAHENDTQASEIQTNEMLESEIHVPRAGNMVTRFLGRCVLRIMGYKLQGHIPNHPKLVVVGTPHTSNLDSVLALGTILSLSLRVNFMMKKEAFFFPLKQFFISIGGIPLERDNPRIAIRQSLKAFEKNDKLWLVITPEGTRKSVSSWKAGFVRIAHKADVPIFIIGIDSRTKTIHFDKLIALKPVYKTSADYDFHAQEIRDYVRARYWGLNPENH